jgi:hypothetical protein
MSALLSNCTMIEECAGFRFMWSERFDALRFIEEYNHNMTTLFTIAEVVRWLEPYLSTALVLPLLNLSTPSYIFL